MGIKDIYPLSGRKITKTEIRAARSFTWIETEGFTFRAKSSLTAASIVALSFFSALRTRTFSPCSATLAARAASLLEAAGAEAGAGTPAPAVVAVAAGAETVFMKG